MAGPILVRARSGLPGSGPGLEICSVPRDGWPLSCNELPVKLCAPADSRARNSMKPSLVALVKVTVKKYDQVSTATESVGPEVMMTFGELEKLNKFSMPGVVTPPDVLVWSKSTSMIWLVAGPPVKETRQGMRSNSFQPVRSTVCQTLLPKD